MCELLVGLPDVDVVGVADPEPGWLVVVVAVREERPVCDRCGAAAWVKDRRGLIWWIFRRLISGWCCGRFALAGVARRFGVGSGRGPLTISRSRRLVIG